MKILGIDIGYSHVKCSFGSPDSEPSTFKFSSTVGRTQRNQHIKDSNVYDYNEQSFYVGETALHLPSDNIINITEYKNLEYYAPLFVAHAIKICGGMPDIIVTGLSKAQINNSGYFKEAISEFVVNNIRYKFDNVFVIPQGAGCKVCSDKYGLEYSDQKSEFSNCANYIGVDGGFNTLDLYVVINGKVSASVFEGIENEGVMKIASKVAKLVQEKHNRNITLHEARDILDTGSYKLRSDVYDYSEELKAIKKEYILDMFNLIEQKYGKIIDKCECIYFSGGASRLFKSGVINGIKLIVPLKNNEFLNSIGQFLFGCEQYRKLKDIQTQVNLEN